MAKITDIGKAMRLQRWDKNTYMPHEGTHPRARQIATLAGLSQTLFTADWVGDMLQQLITDDTLSDRQKRNVQQSLVDYNYAKAMPAEWTEKLVRVVSQAHTAWVDAKKGDDYSLFLTSFKQIVEMKREESELRGYENHPYDVHIDKYEPGATVEKIDAVFVELKKSLLPLLQKINQAEQPRTDFLFRYFPVDKQRELSNKIMPIIGLTSDKSRLDTSAHPFSTRMAPSDVRITTRFSANNLMESLYSTIHECGHGMHSIGLNYDDYGLPSGEYERPDGVSTQMALAESQARLWENNLGRSKAFMDLLYPMVKDTFPEQMEDVSQEEFWKGVNSLQKGFIRTDADELTYHFHIMIRYEIERDLIAGAIEVEDVPNIWNTKYKEYLNIEPKNNTEGCLQDVHWSQGSIGYFPSYSLGSFYAAQYEAALRKNVQDCDPKLALGETKEIIAWLKENIHQHGRLYSSEDLCERVTGEALNIQHFIDYATAKYAEIYSF